MFGWFRKKRQKKSAARQWSLDMPLFYWDEQREDCFTIGDSFCGLLCLGRTGSGKSSATGRHIALAQLAAGFGGLVLTVKPGEKETWNGYCQMTDRLDDLRIVDLSCKHRFNFLREMQQSQGNDSGLTENLVGLLMEVGQIGSRQTNGGSSQGDNAFFQQACRTMLRNTIDLMVMATGTASVGEICRLVAAMPRSMDQVRSEEWRASSYCYRLLKQADERAKSVREQRDYTAVLDYILIDFPSLADRTRSSITATFMAFADLFQRGLLYDLLSTDTTISPREIEDGKIILIDLPLKLCGEVGLTAQLVWKLMTQRFLERRTITPATRPAFIHVDEAQFFASQQSDALFATTCRSARVSNILLSQSISGFETAFGGGPVGKALSEQLFANLATKVIHATGDSGTAEWASTLCGKSYRLLGNVSSGYTGPDWAGMAGVGSPSPSNSGMAESLQFDIEPREFNYLRSGGPENNWLVDGIVIRSGKPFRATGHTWRPVALSQK
jgi:hypothetical protein